MFKWYRFKAWTWQPWTYFWSYSICILKINMFQLFFLLKSAFDTHFWSYFWTYGVQGKVSWYVVATGARHGCVSSWALFDRTLTPIFAKQPGGSVIHKYMYIFTCNIYIYIHSIWMYVSTQCVYISIKNNKYTHMYYNIGIDIHAWSEKQDTKVEKFYFSSEPCFSPADLVLLGF